MARGQFNVELTQADIFCTLLCLGSVFHVADDRVVLSASVTGGRSAHPHHRLRRTS